MKIEKLTIAASLLLVLTACNSDPMDESETMAETAMDDGWVSLSGSFDGWRQVGDANWRIENGEFVADSGSGHLVTEASYEGFELKLEFWVDEPANSGVFMRISNPDAIADTSAYEVNIYDARPDPTYRTGAIVNFEPPQVEINAAGQWNTYEIRADGNQFWVRLNGETTAVLVDNTYDSGPISLQYGAGTVKFRNVQIQEL